MGARIKAYDPVAMGACQHQHPELKIQYCGSAVDVASGADALVIVTEWEEFGKLDLPALACRMANAILIDGRNIVKALDAWEAGFDYSAIGSKTRFPKLMPRMQLRASA
jgi:UDPglucose 6-dehydrogenase